MIPIEGARLTFRVLFQSSDQDPSLLDYFNVDVSLRYLGAVNYSPLNYTIAYNGIDVYAPANPYPHLERVNLYVRLTFVPKYSWGCSPFEVEYPLYQQGNTNTGPCVKCGDNCTCCTCCSASNSCGSSCTCCKCAY